MTKPTGEEAAEILEALLAARTQNTKTPTGHHALPGSFGFSASFAFRSASVTSGQGGAIGGNSGMRSPHSKRAHQ